MTYDPAPLLSALRGFAAQRAPLATSEADLDAVLGGERFETLLHLLIDAPVFTPGFGEAVAGEGAVEAVSALRGLRGALNLSIAQVMAHLSEVFRAMDLPTASGWTDHADAVARDASLRALKLRTFLTTRISDARRRAAYSRLADDLAHSNPHALYPTSSYRESGGRVDSSADARTVEAVMSVTTYASIRVRDHVLDPDDRTLRDIYAPLGRCVAFVDSNVDDYYGEAMDAYFLRHGIRLEKNVYRAMEADKGLDTVERMLGDLKRVKVGRHEPVLVVGGGVLSDTAGLATALYGRNTPYVMLSTSIVTGIDAGPSPRTCCDGFGYKNLLGAYHPPVVSLTDRHFFGTLRDGWVRHGVAEIIKMAVVKNLDLFERLEEGMDRLVPTRFGTVGCAADDPIHDLSNDILAGALKSYIEAEYDNLYETHQCRPHAYGHTWSPGFEIDAGLLHGHAVSIGMGLGAFIAERRSWITRDERDRILRLISGYGLSLWDDILLDEGVMREAHRKMIAKRGGNLVAPLPRGGIGRCGYLDDLSEEQLLEAVAGYRELCAAFPRGGVGIEPLCEDVGLEAADAMGRADMPEEAFIAAQ